MERNRTTKPPLMLHPLRGPIAPEQPDEICSHCKNPFVGRDGLVTGGFNLCPVCNDRD